MTSASGDAHELGGSTEGTSRRAFLARVAAAGLGGAGLLSASGGASPSTAGAATASVAAAPTGPGGLPLARLNQPVTLPLYADNKAIVSGLKPEKGPLQFYNWIAYINPAVVKDFEKKYKVQVQISTFNTIDEAIAKISSKAVQFDMFTPETVFLERLVVGKLLQPLNHTYIPNLHANVWPTLQNPWYDQSSRYSVPYTVYTTGIGWRADKLPGFDPAKLANPWNALWQVGPSISGRVGLLDDQHEGLAMALLRDVVTDVNTENPRLVNAAGDALKHLITTTNLKFDTNEYQHLADGSLWLHQAWSGDMASAPQYLPKGTPARVLRYWWPTDGRGPINNDMFGILQGAKNPVLAHLFMNHLLDTGEVFKNFTFTGYQQPITAMTPAAVVKQGVVPTTLSNTIFSESQFKHGYVQGPLSTAGEILWENAWAAVKSA
jgi:spermidine/putrescine transport system substrate-binding protein